MENLIIAVVLYVGTFLIVALVIELSNNGAINKLENEHEDLKEEFPLMYNVFKKEGRMDVRGNIKETTKHKREYYGMGFMAMVSNSWLILGLWFFVWLFRLYFGI